MSSSYKHVQCTGTVSSVSDAYSALEELGSECREVVDNASEGLSQTQRIQTFDETAGVLENLSEPDVPECVGELAITYSERTPKHKRRAPSRAVRCSNAVSVLQAAADALEEWLDDEQNSEHDDRDEVQSLLDQLQNDAGEAENCEFPGMYG